MSEEQNEQRETESVGIPPEAKAALVATLLGGGNKGVHEIGVQGSVIEQTVDLVEEYVKPDTGSAIDPLTGTEAPIVRTKDGVEALPASVFNEYLERPRRRRGTAELASLASFIDHTKRFKSDNSAIFANDDRRAPSLTAVLNYHPAGDELPEFGDHRGLFRFPLSDEWQAWQASDKKPMGLGDFAAFLEERIVDVEHPSEVEFSDDQAQSFIDKLGGRSKIASPTRLLELSQGLSVNENSVVRETTKLASGEGQVVFQSEHTDANGQAIDIPSLFVVTIPVFRNDGYYRVIARLRYRVRPALTFWYELWRTDRVFDHAFKLAVEGVKGETGLPVFLGKPE